MWNCRSEANAVLWSSGLGACVPLDLLQILVFTYVLGSFESVWQQCAIVLHPFRSHIFDNSSSLFPCDVHVYCFVSRFLLRSKICQVTTPLKLHLVIHWFLDNLTFASSTVLVFREVLCHALHGSF